MCCAGDKRLAGLCHPSPTEEKDLNTNAADSAMNLHFFLLLLFLFVFMCYILFVVRLYFLVEPENKCNDTSNPIM